MLRRRFLLAIPFSSSSSGVLLFRFFLFFFIIYLFLLSLTEVVESRASRPQRRIVPCQCVFSLISPHPHFIGPLSRCHRLTVTRPFLFCFHFRRHRRLTEEQCHHVSCSNSATRRYHARARQNCAREFFKHCACNESIIGLFQRGFADEERSKRRRSSVKRWQLS